VEDLTDNEREEQLRRWWSDNWAWIIGGVALGLAILGGWQYWQRHQQQSAEQDEASYVAVVRALDGNNRDEAVKQAAELQERHPGSPYADQADLALARAAVDRREFDEAARLLRSVADRSKDAELRMVAKTRLARVLLEQGKHDDALALLDASQAGAFAALAHEIRGDAFAAKVEPVQARTEYDAALKASTPESGIDSVFVELKRDALGQAAPAPPGDTAAPPATGAPVAESPAQ
jgi:predicted negative regulator of RcsB-dependent stress response